MIFTGLLHLDELDPDGTGPLHPSDSSQLTHAKITHRTPQRRWTTHNCRYALNNPKFTFIVSSSTIDKIYKIYTFYENRYEIYTFYENFVPIFVKSADFVPIFVKSVI